MAGEHEEVDVVTAALELTGQIDEADGADRIYPERVSVRLMPADYPTYDVLDDAVEEVDDVAASHVLVALLERFAGDPALRTEIMDRAVQISWRNRSNANSKRASTWRDTTAKKAARRSKRTDT